MYPQHSNIIHTTKAQISATHKQTHARVIPKVPKAAIQANGDHASHQCVRLLLKYRCKDEQLLKNRQSSFDTTKDRVAPSKDPLDMFRDLNTGDSILMSAVASHAHNPGIHHVVFSLLEAGALVNQRRRGDRRSALHIACSSRRRVRDTFFFSSR